MTHPTHTPQLQIARTGDVEVPLPAYQTPGSAGMDLAAALKEPITLGPGRRVRVPTGLRIAVPLGYEAQVRPRSGWAAKEGVTVLNAPGTIDSDYRGPLEILLINTGDRDVVIAPFDRIAQLVVAPVAQAEILCVEELSDTVRGAGGFGSTGR